MARSAARRGSRQSSGGISGRSLVAFIAVVAAFLVIYSASAPERLFLRSGGRHFVYLAEAFLRGHLDLVSVPPSYHDMTNLAGRWFVPFPPFPAVLLAPFVAIWGLAVPEVLVSVALGALNCGLTWILLGRVERLTPGAQIALTVLFGLGTAHWYSVLAGSVWFFAHVVAVTFLSLYALEVLGPNRPLVAAGLLGLAGLARTPALFGFPLFLAFALARRRSAAGRRSPLADVALFGAGLGVVVLAMLLYNQARFGSPLDFGYLRMQIFEVLAPRLREHGQFSLAFLPENLYYFLIAPPDLIDRSPFLEPSQWGLGIIFASPGILYACRGLRPTAVSVGAALSALLVAIPNLLYYNTGWVQFGYRFSLDFLPFLMILAAIGTRGKVGRLGLFLIALAVVANFWGYHWFFRIPIFGFQVWTAR